MLAPTSTPLCTFCDTTGLNVRRSSHVSSVMLTINRLITRFHAHLSGNHDTSKNSYVPVAKDYLSARGVNAIVK
ncbi:hypothetical protein EV363DRAFT_1178908 [Boletus edulis]|nr:hypothetical protein EV363DRAFT_1178908 [Boletus edulis]